MGKSFFFIVLDWSVLFPPSSPSQHGVYFKHRQHVCVHLALATT